MNDIKQMEEKIKSLINMCDVIEGTADIIIKHDLKHDKTKVKQMLEFLEENVSKRKVTQSEIIETAMDLDDPSWRWIRVLIEDDDGTCYTQEEWKEKIEKEN